MSENFTVLGIDLAWGNRMPDAIARVDFVNGKCVIHGSFYTQGNEALCDVIREQMSDALRVILAIDAPMLCQNESGSRPVDKECSRLFRQYEAGSHPVNHALCKRPLEVAQLLTELGYSHSWDLAEQRIAMEVYPHPTMIRWFELVKTIKYKKGKVADKRLEFARYQRLFENWLSNRYGPEVITCDLSACLERPWSKEVEDRLDAYFCAMVGYEYALSEDSFQVLGDRESGFMVV